MKPWKTIFPKKSLQEKMARRLLRIKGISIGFAAFMERYKKGLVIERAAVDVL